MRWSDMYRLTDYEYKQFERSLHYLRALQKQHNKELQQAYADIFPTRTGYDFNIGKIFSESLDPAEYAIYLVDLQEQYKRIESYWEIRREAFMNAYRMLSEEQRNNYNSHIRSEREIASNLLRNHLDKIVNDTPKLQRKSIPIDLIESMEEADERIEKMSNYELLKGYIDFIGER